MTLVYMRIKSSNKIKLESILTAQNVKCKVTKGRQILSGHPNLTYATTPLIIAECEARKQYVPVTKSGMTRLGASIHTTEGQFSTT